MELLVAAPHRLPVLDEAGDVDHVADELRDEFLVSLVLSEQLSAARAFGRERRRRRLARRRRASRRRKEGFAALDERLAACEERAAAAALDEPSLLGDSLLLDAELEAEDVLVRAQVHRLLGQRVQPAEVDGVELARHRRVLQ